MIYDFNTEYMTKTSAACYDVDINNTGKYGQVLNSL